MHFRGHILAGSMPRDSAFVGNDLAFGTQRQKRSIAQLLGSDKSFYFI